MEIPNGFCQCGCGGVTSIAINTEFRRGIKKGEHRRYIHGHNSTHNRITKFWRHIIKKDGCWAWDGNKHKRGYGQLKEHGKTIRAHRISWNIHFGEIPEGLSVMHKCDNPECCNPEHLTVGSHLDNMRDMYAKGRRKPVNGEKHHLSKLTVNHVIDIRSRLDIGQTSVSLAEEYRVSASAIKAIKYRKSWKHI